MLKLKRATAADSDLILGWRNDPATYCYYLENRPVARSEHAAWFAARLKDPRTKIFVAYSGRKPVGQVRLDMKGRKSAEVSVSIDKGSRGRGLGIAALHAIGTVGKRLELGKLIAFVQTNNISSAAAFLNAGYEFVGRNRIKGRDVYRMEQSLNPGPSHAK